MKKLNLPNLLHKSCLVFFSSLPLLLICKAGGFSFFLGFLILLTVLVDCCRHMVECVFEDGILQLALPDDDDGPALGLQLAPDFLVALLVSYDFTSPIICI